MGLSVPTRRSSLRSIFQVARLVLTLSLADHDLPRFEKRLRFHRRLPKRFSLNQIEAALLQVKPTPEAHAAICRKTINDQASILNRHDLRTHAFESGKLRYISQAD